MKKIIVSLLLLIPLKSIAMEPQTAATPNCDNIPNAPAAGQGDNLTKAFNNLRLENKALQTTRKKRCCMIASFLTCTCCCYPCYEQCCFDDEQKD